MPVKVLGVSRVWNEVKHDLKGDHEYDPPISPITSHGFCFTKPNAVRFQDFISLVVSISLLCFIWQVKNGLVNVKKLLIQLWVLDLFFGFLSVMIHCKNRKLQTSESKLIQCHPDFLGRQFTLNGYNDVITTRSQRQWLKIHSKLTRHNLTSHPYLTWSTVFLDLETITWINPLKVCSLLEK